LHLIVGLGNPGGEYRATRHNVGFMVIDALATRYGLTLAPAPGQVPDTLVAKRYGDRPVLLAKPLTFMNRSGDAVASLVRYFDVGLDDLLVVVDEAALPLGKLRARPRGSAGGHNGLKSVIARLGTTDVPRLRLGVGRGDGRRDLSAHVLGAFEADEQSALEELIACAGDAVEAFVADGLARVMNVYNPDPPGPEID
jgi:PTH1 family peptidyl-tRNA hydrolase